MDAAAYFARASVLVVAGKGGVGKSTVTATVALAAAREGARVLALELEGREELARAYGCDATLGSDPLLAHEDPSGGSVRLARLRPDDALVEWLSAHALGAVVRRLRRSGALEVVAFAIPGIREVLVLGKLKSLERQGAYDLCVLDAPATGHALTLLTSPAGLAVAARAGPVRRVAQEVSELLADPARCRVLLVTLPRELAVDETIEAAYEVEERAGVKLAEVLVNEYEPPDQILDAPVDDEEAAALGPRLAAPAEAARAFCVARARAAQGEVDRLRAALPLPVLALPHVDGARIGPAELAVLATALRDAIGALGR